jgi:hypothetical protein
MSDIKGGEAKYIIKDEFPDLLAFDYKAVALFSNDTINETKLVETIKKTGKQEELLIASIQMAIIGFGGRSYLKYMHKGEIKDLKVLFNNTNVKFNNALADVLNPEQLTPRRLLRIFRFQINKYLNENKNIESYLYSKYSRKEEKFRTICFPGAEHLIKYKIEADYLLETYKNLDDSLIKAGKQSGIYERIRRVLLARRLE